MIFLITFCNLHGQTIPSNSWSDNPYNSEYPEYSCSNKVLDSAECTCLKLAQQTAVQLTNLTNCTQ